MNRIKWKKTDLENAHINSLDSEFMEKCGLPNLQNDELEFFVDKLIPTINGTDCHYVGKYGILNDVPLYVRESIKGIWTIDEVSNNPILVNSSTKIFSKFIELRQKYLLDIGKLIPSTMQEEFVLIIKKTMEEIDEPAIKNSLVWGPFMEDLCNQSVYYG